MQLDKNLWYIQFHYWIADRWHVIWHNRPMMGYPTEVNTCQLIRSFLVTFPAIMVIYATVILLPFIALFAPPAYYFGVIGVIYTTGIVIGVVGFIIALVYTIAGFATAATFINRQRKNIQERIETNFDTEKPGFLSMVMKMFMDWHSKVCTRYTIKHGE